MLLLKLFMLPRMVVIFAIVLVDAVAFLVVVFYFCFSHRSLSLLCLLDRPKLCKQNNVKRPRSDANNLIM